jgi:hypothetical protein
MYHYRACTDYNTVQQISAFFVNVCEMNFFLTNEEDQERISIVDLVLMLEVISVYERNSRNTCSSYMEVFASRKVAGSRPDEVDFF